MKKYFLALLSALAVGFIFKCATAEQPGQLPAYQPIQPANANPTDNETITGTVTVRLDGVLVNAQSVRYIFSPEFTLNTGPLKNTEYGTYFLKADNVPKMQSYTLTISANYDDSVKGADGVIEQQGHAYTGSVTIDVPFGGDYDFGVQFIDLH